MYNKLKNLDKEKPMELNVLIIACALSIIIANGFQLSLIV